jgi:hypothetical protein
MSQTDCLQKVGVCRRDPSHWTVIPEPEEEDQ